MCLFLLKVYLLVNVDERVEKAVKYSLISFLSSMHFLSLLILIVLFQFMKLVNVL